MGGFFRMVIQKSGCPEQASYWFPPSWSRYFSMFRTPPLSITASPSSHMIMITRACTGSLRIRVQKDIKFLLNTGGVGGGPSGLWVSDKFLIYYYLEGVVFWVHLLQHLEDLGHGRPLGGVRLQAPLCNAEHADGLFKRVADQVAVYCMVYALAVGHFFDLLEGPKPLVRWWPLDDEITRKKIRSWSEFATKYHMGGPVSIKGFKMSFEDEIYIFLWVWICEKLLHEHLLFIGMYLKTKRNNRMNIYYI